MARNSDSLFDDDFYDDPDGSSFDDSDEMSYLYDIGWKKTEVNVTWYNPLTWIMFVFASVWNAMKWSWWRWRIHIYAAAEGNREWIKLILVDGFIALIMITAIWIMGSGQFRGWTFALSSIGVSLLTIDAAIASSLRALMWYGSRN